MDEGQAQKNARKRTFFSYLLLSDAFSDREVAAHGLYTGPQDILAQPDLELLHFVRGLVAFLADQPLDC